MNAQDVIKELLGSDPSDNQDGLVVEDRCVTPVPKWTKTFLPASASSTHPVRKGPRGYPRVCDENGRLFPRLTTKTEGQLKGRKYLEANELDLLISLLKIYTSARVEKVPDQTHQKEITDLFLQGLYLNEKKKLSVEKE